jgi:hypothetical protein
MLLAGLAVVLRRALATSDAIPRIVLAGAESGQRRRGFRLLGGAGFAPHGEVLPIAFEC